MLKVKSKVYSMDFWLADEVSYDNIRIERIGTREEYKEVRKKIEKERRHYQTGVLTIEIPGEVETISEAKNYSLGLIEKLHPLLSFSHGHDVPIHELMVYEVSKSQEVLRDHEISAIWLGKPGAGSLNIYYGLDKFLATALPLLSNGDFVSKTSILLAIFYYNFARNLDFLDTKFLLLWLGLESMANAYYDTNQTDLVLTRTEWNGLKEKIRLYLTEIGKEDVYVNLLQDVSFLRQGTVKERIDYMLKGSEYKMEQYSSEVALIYDKMRVPLFHGRKIDWSANYDPHKKVYRLKRLMEKLIFKTLNFYENDMIYYAIKEDDLSAR